MPIEPPPVDISLATIFLSETVGTAILLLLGAGVCCAVSLNGSKAKDAGWLVVNFGWGLAVFAGVLASYKSGGHLNPAVTLGLVASKAGTENPEFVPGIAINAGSIGVYIGAQLLGAFIGSALAWLTYKKQFDVDQPDGVKLGVFATGPAIRSYGWNVVTEAMGAFVLVFIVLAAGHWGNSETSTPAGLGWLGALGVALLIVGIGTSLGGPTGYAINPARDLAPRLWHAIMPVPNKGGSDWAYAWVPVVGPIIGGLAAGFASGALLP
ncbi:MAG: aquaporin family protein [Propionibacteriaceae bacterium]|jgi:glycerol uptake facilitator protein|nr:aquaporin family protein [Propionibacteriaceae bacterium]